MISRLLSANIQKVKKINNTNIQSSLSIKPHYKMSSISEYVRKFMNRIRFQDNRALQTTKQKATLQILQTPQQVAQKFIGDQQFKSAVEKQRMQKIDAIIGTKTYFHQTKKYQQRLDSDHVMIIDDLAKKYPEPKRQHLNWENTQAPQQYKVKSTRKFNKNLKNLRQYPKHNYRIVSFIDEKQQENIEFLGKQSLYSKLSLKWVDTYQKSLQNEIIDDNSYQLHAYRYSDRYVYFASEYEPSKLYRTPKGKFTQKLIQSVKTFQQLKQDIEEVISMQEIYDELKQYFHDQRVTQWLKKVQNGQISYLLSGYKTNQNEDGVIIWVDLMGNKKEYVHLYKKIGLRLSQKLTKDSQKKSGKQPSKQEKQQLNNSNQQNNNINTYQPFSNPPVQFQNRLVFNCKPQASFSLHNNKIFLIQRSQEGSFIQLIYVPIELNHTLGQPSILYKCKLYEEMDLVQDDGLGYLFLKLTDNSKGESKFYAIEESLSNSKDGNENVSMELVPINTADVEFIDNQQNDNSGINQQTQQQPQKTKTQNQSNKYSKQSPQKKIKPSTLSVTSCPQGLIFTNFYPAKEYFKYGPHSQFAKKVHLIPFKSHIQLLNETNNKISQEHLLPGHSQTNNKSINRPSIRQLDDGNKRVLFECPHQQFISEVSVRESHLIVSLSTISIYNKKRLLFIPHDKSKNPHSLIFPSQSLRFLNTGSTYSSQTLSFTINRSSLLNEHFQYTIWKKQLKQLVKDQMYLQTLRVNANVEVSVMCLNRYLQHLPKFYNDNNNDQLQQEQQQQAEQVNKIKDNYRLENTKVPILIYLNDQKTDHNINNKSRIQQTHLRQFLQKGTLILTVSCRGSLSSDLTTFFKGSGQNFSNYIEDIQSTIQWVGNNLGTNISLYSNGYISSLVGMMINVRHPFLLTSTVLHNGVYQLIDNKQNLLTQKQVIEYFVRFDQLLLNKTQQQTQTKKSTKQLIKYWSHYNPGSFLFKRSKIATKKAIQEEPKIKIDQDQQNNNDDSQESQNTQQQPNTIKQEKQLPKIGTLENILISCSNNSLAKQQARKMIYHLRRNPHLKYQEVYLKQFIEGEDRQLFNLAFIYGKMKQRLQQDHMKL